MTGTDRTSLIELGRRLWTKADTDAGIDECWEWRDDHASQSGYGYIWIPAIDNMMAAHRAAYAIAHGIHPCNLDAEHVRHVCPDGPNKACINPRHLEPGTAAQNMRDAIRDGAHEGFTPEQVRQIRERFANGERQTDIADEFDVPDGTISRIINNERHADV